MVRLEMVDTGPAMHGREWPAAGRNGAAVGMEMPGKRLGAFSLDNVTPWQVCGDGAARQPSGGRVHVLAVVAGITSTR
jgi:hypothetical protein